LEKIIRSYAPHIYGYDIQKKSILLQAVKGNNGIKRANIHILFVGDPSVAKSELLIWNKKVVDISGYISGKGTTEKGITIGIVKEDNGKTYARAGLAPQCNKGVLAIDEMGQMNVSNLSGLHEVMEQRQCSISKAGHHLTLEADTSILGAANPKYGKYDSEETLLENINLPAPLLSRFDLIWLIKDDIIEDEDKKKAEHIISTYINPEEATKCYLTPFELSGYLSLTRKLEPKITETVRDKILKIYHQMRVLSSNSTSIAIGARQLEALVRLSAAHAKLLFKDEVTVDDVSAVQDMLKDMYGKFGISLEIGTEFNQTKLIGVNKNESREQIANRVWKNLSDGEGLVKDIHFYKMMEKEDGITEDDAKKIFGRWELNCEIKLVKDHFYKKT
jgi:replicative DNA helicase Mcm